MRRIAGLPVLAMLLAFTLIALTPDSASADDRTVWKATDGTSIKQEGAGKVWRVYRADGSEALHLVETERTSTYVLLYEEVTQKYLRLESGQLLVAGRHRRDWTKTKDGDWVTTGLPPPAISVTSVWVMADGRAGFRHEGGSAWREFGTDGRPLSLFTELERGSSHVVLRDDSRGISLKLDTGICSVKLLRMRDFVPQWNGNWAAAAPRHWQVPAPQVGLTSVWLMQGGRAGFRRESDKTWWEYSTTGQATTRFTERERGITYVLLHDAGRGVYLRLEGDRCLIKRPGQLDFSTQWYGNWAAGAPSHWRDPAPQVLVTSVWIMQGGRAGFRHEGGNTWREYGIAGRPLSRYTERERGAAHVLLHDTGRGVFLRLEAGQSHIKLPGRRDFSPQWNGNWTSRAPSHWQNTTAEVVVTSVWLIKGGMAGYHQEDGTTWREYSTGGKPLSLFTEQERGADHLVLHDSARGISVRLEAGRSLLKLRGRRQFVPQWEGNWAAAAPSHWRISRPQSLEIWLLSGGGGYRREGSPPVWVAYGPAGNAASRFVEENRTAAFVQIREQSQGLRIRLLAGELQVQDQRTGRFVRQAAGNWSDRAPSNWPPLATAPRVTSVWVFAAGGGFLHSVGDRWVEYNVDGSQKKDLTEFQRTDEYVVLRSTGRGGRVVSLKLQADRCLVQRHGLVGWTLLAEGRWAANTPAHWRAGANVPGHGGTSGRRSIWKGANQDFYQNEGGRWTHYQGRTRRPVLEYVERSRTRQFIELWNPAQNLGARLYSDRCEIWNRRFNKWSRGQNGGWVQEAPPVPDQPRRHPKTQVIPLFTESVNCTPIGSQAPQVFLRVARAVGLAADGSRYAHVSLDDSTVTATRGAMTENRDDRRGFFLESVKVTIEPTDNTLSLHSDGPGAFTGKGSLVSISGVNLFSGRPVSTVLPRMEIGRANNFGMRHTETYVDFHVANGTRAPKVEHTYNLATVVAPGSSWSRNGGTVLYRTWKDLASSRGDSDLCGLPPRSVKNFPLISQATFLARENFIGVASVKVTLEITFRYVKKEGRRFSLKVKDRSQVEAVTRTFEFDFSTLK